MINIKVLSLQLFVFGAINFQVKASSQWQVNVGGQTVGWKGDPYFYTPSFSIEKQWMKEHGGLITLNSNIILLGQLIGIAIHYENRANIFCKNYKEDSLDFWQLSKLCFSRSLYVGYYHKDSGIKGEFSPSAFAVEQISVRVSKCRAIKNMDITFFIHTSFSRNLVNGGVEISYPFWVNETSNFVELKFMD